ncbi:hypothetical protein CA833_0075 [Novosphingobium sp. KA1]|nr:hypothetical protein CA833_0075 [Novosphingobium sp. KA1]
MEICILATYEDAVRLEEIVNSTLAGEQVDANDKQEYSELLQRLITENDEEVATLAANLHLGSSLERLAADTRSRRENMLTSTDFTKGMRRIKDILIARKRGDDRLVRRADPVEAKAPDTGVGTAASEWTGASTPRDRMASVKVLLPVAQVAIEQLIASLEARQHNGGPPLDDCQNALEALRDLHTALGNLLIAADEGRLNQEYHGGLCVEAVRYAKRAARALGSDPLPFATAATVLAIMCACGFPTVGAFLADVAFSVRRPTAR